MPTIYCEEGFRFFFYSHEPGEPPHVHVEKGDGGAKLWLQDASVARNSGLKPKELSAVAAIVRAKRESMLEAWHGYFGT